MESRKVACECEQPFGMLADVFLPDAMDLDASGALWVPKADGVWFRPLILDVSQRDHVNLLRVRKSGILSRHRHSGPVHAFALRGRWRCLEHDWEAAPGAHLCEPPGETHTLVDPDDVDEMITSFHVTGRCVYVDPQGRAEGYEDVFTKPDAARKHCAAVGLGRDLVEGLMR